MEDAIRWYCPQLKLTGIASNGEEGVRLINEISPELVFLGIELHDMSGFELLRRISPVHFEVIFVTEYTQYAIKAIRFNALDYLLKPIDIEELQNAIDRFIEKHPHNDFPKPDVSHAINNYFIKKEDEQVLTINTQEGKVYLPIKEIVRLEGDRNYTAFKLDDGKSILASKTLHDWEFLLDDKGFFRLHNSHLINRTHLKSVQKNGEVLMSDGELLPVARRKKGSFQSWLDSFKN